MSCGGISESAPRRSFVALRSHHSFLFGSIRKLPQQWNAPPESTVLCSISGFTSRAIGSASVFSLRLLDFHLSAKVRSPEGAEYVF